MTFRSILVVAIAVFPLLGAASAASGEMLASHRPTARLSQSRASVPQSRVRIEAYRHYAKSQADVLVGLTRLLAGQVKSGDIEGARMSYAPAHSYFKRLEPIARTLGDLKPMDALAGAYAMKEADPRFSGFHRIEHGLFRKRSTADLTDYAERLYEQSRVLQERVAVIDIRPDDLINEAADLMKEAATKRLDGDQERYSQTYLWDLEANADGVQEILALSQPRLHAQDGVTFRNAVHHLQDLNELLAKHNLGCRFRNYNELSRAEKMELQGPLAALADELAVFRGLLATD